MTAPNFFGVELFKVLKNNTFINARKLARKLGISSKEAGQLLKKLRDEGFVELYTDRVGRFKVYRVRKRLGF